MSIIAFMLKRFVWKTKVCHPSVENQPQRSDVRPRRDASGFPSLNTITGVDVCEGDTQFAEFYRIEDTIRSLPPEQCCAARQDQARPFVDDLRAWLETTLTKLSRRSRTAEAIRYALKLWSGLGVFVDDGRVEIDSNVVERSIRPIALNRKNAFFAGSDQGGVHWAVIASLIETERHRPAGLAR